MISTEHQEQVGFLMWFRYKYPNILIFAIPNGGHRSLKTAKNLKDEGVVPGIPDLYVPEWKLWVEMKRTKCGSVSEDQKRIIQYLISIGDTVIVGYGANDASQKVLKFRKV